MLEGTTKKQLEGGMFHNVCMYIEGYAVNVQG